MIAERSSRVSLSTMTGPALALALGVVTFEQFVHASRGLESSGSPLTHLALDAVLAVPLAFIAVWVGHRARTAWSRAALASFVFTLMLIPAVGAHHVIHALIAPTHNHAFEHLLAAQGIGSPSGIAHGLRDAVAALPLALLIASLSFGARLRLRAHPAIVALAAAMVVTALPLVAQGAGPVITPFTSPLFIPPTLTSSDVTLTAAQTPVQILPGAPTMMWTYNGTFPGPTIRRTSAQATNVTVVNNLPASAGALTLHHHGEHAESDADGQPDDNLIETGAQRTYTYDLTEGGPTTPERGAFQWYHDHRMDVTGRNVWMGLAGMVILDDPSEAAINDALPSGDRDVPLMVVDRSFTTGNQMPYGFNLEGNAGSAILVNGVAQPYFEVSDTRYRLRLLNASNARSYDFAMSDGRPMVHVATESGLLPKPISLTHVLLGPAERAEVIVDFSGALGQNITLKNTIGFGPNLSQAMQFRVARHESDASSIPATLRAAPTFDDLPTPSTIRTWLFGRDLNTGMWTINNQGFDHARMDASPKLGTVERWIFVNTTSVDHIVHIHDVDWHIVSRVIGDTTLPDAVLGEVGLRESFRLRPNEVVTVESRFTDHLGTYVFHCHILEHEDFAMMGQFRVVL